MNVLKRRKISGVCRCNIGYIGEDCSYNTSYPPTDISFPFYGLCKLRTRACKATNVFGEFYSTFIWGKQRHFQVYEITFIQMENMQSKICAIKLNFGITSKRQQRLSQKFNDCFQQPKK